MSKKIDFVETLGTVGIILAFIGILLLLAKVISGF